MRRELKSNTSIGSTAPANSAKSVDSSMSRNHAKIWENRIETEAFRESWAFLLTGTSRQFLPLGCRCKCHRGRCRIILAIQCPANLTRETVAWSKDFSLGVIGCGRSFAVYVIPINT
jgi:hypothetical protein